MRSLTIYTGTSRKARLWKAETLSWEELRQRLTTFRVTSETAREYATMTREQQTAIKDVGGFVGGTLDGGIRKKANLRSRSLVTLDYDAFTPAQLSALAEEFPGVAWVVYSTHKHTPEAWRVRVVIPLASDVDPEKYEAIARRVASMIGTAGIDRTTTEASRMMFWGSRSCDADYIARSNDGEALDPDAILATFDDWRDHSTWPLFPGEADLFALPEQYGATMSKEEKELIWREILGSSVAPGRGSGMEDPTAKQGIIGAFCRAYPISRAIEELIPGTYRLYRPGRYTYTNGSTHGGAVAYEDKWLYSNHATDPCGGHEVNAWDLVRIHKFGHLDTGRARGLDAASAMAMVDFAKTLPEVRKALAEETAEKARAFDSIELPEEDAPEEDADAWEDTEADLRDRKGKFMATRYNIARVILLHPQMRQKLRYNEMTYNLEATGLFPWKRPESPTFTDIDMSGLRGWLETTYDVNGKDKVEDAVNIAKGYICYHPIKEYLKNLPEWDGVERLPYLFPHVLGAEDSEYTRTLSCLPFVAAVARIQTPGLKFDICTTLFGPEGCYKSTVFRVMGGDWFMDSKINIGNKDSYGSIRGKWLIEMAEMASFKRADQDDVKGFISSQCDTFRPPYGRTDIVAPRQCVFVATTNDEACLRGFGANRRFPVVDIMPELSRYPRQVDKYVEANRDQLWAEAQHLYRKGFPLYLSPELEEVARAKAAAHSLELTNPMFDLIDDYLERPIPHNWQRAPRDVRKAWYSGRYIEPLTAPDSPVTILVPRTQVCIEEIMTECLDLRKGTKDYTSQAREVARWIDREKPEWRRVYRVPKDSAYGRGRGWVRDEPPEPIDEDSII